jgi:hypothetical protein
MITLPQFVGCRGSAGFSPGLLGTLVADYDASLLSFADGAAVDTWTDNSGNARHVTQATAGLRPLYRTNILNGLPVVEFDGSDDFLGRADTGFPTAALTVMGVMRCTITLPANTSRAVAMWGAGSGAGQGIVYMFSNSGALVQAYAVSARAISFGTNNQVNLWGVFTLTRSTPSAGNATYNLWVNGASNATQVMAAATTLGNEFRLGAGNSLLANAFFPGRLARLLVWSTELTVGNRQLAERALGGRYGITVA